MQNIEQSCKANNTETFLMWTFWLWSPCGATRCTGSTTGCWENQSGVMKQFSHSCHQSIKHFKLILPRCQHVWYIILVIFLHCQNVVSIVLCLHSVVQLIPEATTMDLMLQQFVDRRLWSYLGSLSTETGPYYWLCSLWFTFCYSLLSQRPFWTLLKSFPYYGTRRESLNWIWSPGQPWKLLDWAGVNLGRSRVDS